MQVWLDVSGLINLHNLIIDILHVCDQLEDDPDLSQEMKKSHLVPLRQKVLSLRERLLH